MKYEGILAHRKKNPKTKSSPVEVLVSWADAEPSWVELSKLEPEAYWPILHYMERRQLQNEPGWKHLNRRGWEARVYASGRDRFATIAEMQKMEIHYELAKELIDLT